MRHQSYNRKLDNLSLLTQNVLVKEIYPSLLDPSRTPIYLQIPSSFVGWGKSASNTYIYNVIEKREFKCIDISKLALVLALKNLDSRVRKGTKSTF